MSIVERFSKYLEDITYPTKPEGWHIQGRIKNKSNQIFKFDVRGMKIAQDGGVQKKGTTASKAEKMVFETAKEWIIIDLEELHNHIREQQIKVVVLEDLIYKLDWNIILVKNYASKNTI